MVTEIIGTPFVFYIVDVVTKVDITVGNPIDWVILPIVMDERVCSYFEGCSGPLYECFFTRLGILLPFSDVHVAVMDHLKFQGLEYEELFGSGEVIYFQQQKMQIDTHVIISVSHNYERQNLFGEDRDPGSLFQQCSMCLLDKMDQLSQLQKALAIAND